MLSKKRIKGITVAVCATACLVGGNFAKASYDKLIDENMKQQQEIQALNAQVDQLEEEVCVLETQVKDVNEKLNQVEEQKAIEEQYQFYTVTAYDLSEASTEKSLSDPGYGVTASGISLAGLSHTDAMAIAVDPNVIPLGSKVEIIFEDESVAQYSGVYTAVDTGGAINGARIDLFVGDFSSSAPSKKALDFGRRTAKVRIL